MLTLHLCGIKEPWEDEKLNTPPLLLFFTQIELSIYLLFSLQVSKFSHECLFRRESLRLQEVE